MLHRILSLEEKLNPEHTALIVIDIQNDFCDTDGFLARSIKRDVSMMPELVTNLYPLLESARRNQVLLIFIKAVYNPVYISEPQAERARRTGTYGKFCLEGTWGTQFWGEIGPQGNQRELTVTKHRYSAFAGTELDLILRSNGIKTIVITGESTSCCVESAVRDGFFNGYYIIVPSDCVCDFTEEWHEASLNTIKRLFADIVLSSEIIKIWSRRAKK